MIDQTQTLKDLQELEKLFSDETKWGKGMFHNKTEDCYCLAGGIMKVIGTKDYKNYGMLEPRAQHAREALGFFGPGDLILWNDSRLTAHSSVMKRIRAAIEKLTPKKPKAPRKPAKKKK